MHMQAYQLTHFIQGHDLDEIGDTHNHQQTVSVVSKLNITISGHWLVMYKVYALSLLCVCVCVCVCFIGWYYSSLDGERLVSKEVSALLKGCRPLNHLAFSCGQ